MPIQRFIQKTLSLPHRIGIGRFWHESNSFFALNTELADFQPCPGGLLIGEAILQQPKHSDEITGMLDVFEDDESIEPFH